MNLHDKKFLCIFIGFLILSVFIMLISFSIGYYKIHIKDIIPTILKTADGSNEYNIIMNIRLPRIIGAFLIGALLSVSGSTYQKIFKSPLVSPDILGASSGAGLGASIGITLNMPYYSVQMLAFLFGIFSVFLCCICANKSKTSLILSGLMIQALSNSFIAFLKYIADTDTTLPEITFWLMGSVSKIDKRAILFSIIPIIIGLFVIYTIRYKINILTLSDDECKSIGLNPMKIRIIAIISSTILTASAVCLGGIIGFVGLIIPHISMWLVGEQYEKQFIISFLIGGCFLLFFDNIARSIFIMEIPIGIITSFIGAPFFLYLMKKRRV